VPLLSLALIVDMALATVMNLSILILFLHIFLTRVVTK